MLIEEVCSTATKATARAMRSRGFDPGRALRGAAVESNESACTSRGDGKYENGTHFTKVRLKGGQEAVQIGPNAFAPDQVEDTMKQLEKMGALGTKRGGGENTSQKDVPKVTKSDAAETMPRQVQTSATAAASTQYADLQAVASALYGEKTNDTDLERARERERMLDNMLDEGKDRRSDFVLGALEPEYSVKRDDNARKLFVVLSLAQAQGPTDVELDVTECELRITPTTKAGKDARYRLRMRLPLRVDASTARAKWSKVKKTLNVSVDYHASVRTASQVAAEPVPTVLTKAEALRGRGTVDYEKWQSIDPDLL